MNNLAFHWLGYQYHEYRSFLKHIDWDLPGKKIDQNFSSYKALSFSFQGKHFSQTLVYTLESKSKEA